MLRIVCDSCKNAFLQKEDGKLVCPSCKAVFPAESENLFLGMQYYREGDYSKATDSLMKAIVTDAGEPRALIFKALCDGFLFDEDTFTLSDTYKKIKDAFASAGDADFPALLAIANDEAKKLEAAFTEAAVRVLETADAEVIKKQVALILKIRDEALAFRADLKTLTAEYNTRNEKHLQLNACTCYFVSVELATEIKEKKQKKIMADIADHTVFTGILGTDIRNLEIFERCIVMFFEKSKDKYNYLMQSATEFDAVNAALNEGNYASLAGSVTTGEKIKNIAYTFFEDSLKEHDNPSVFADTVIELEPEPTAVLEPVSTAVLSDTAEVAEDEAAEDEAAEDEAAEAEVAIAIEAADAEAVAEIEEKVLEAEAEIDEQLIDAEITADSDEASSESEELIPEEAEEVVSDKPSEKASEDTAADEEDAVIELNPDSDAEAISEAPVAEKSGTEFKVTIPPEEMPAAEEEKADDNADNSNTEAAKNTDSDEAESSENKPDSEEPANEESKADESSLKNRKKKKSAAPIILLLLLVVLLGLLGWKYVPGLISESRYRSASELAASAKYEEAAAAFTALEDYKDSADKVSECKYSGACELRDAEKYAEAAVIFEALGEYKDSITQTDVCKYAVAKAALEAKNFDEAEKLFTEIKDYGDSAEMIKECSYQKALSLIENKSYEDAIALLTSVGKYSDSTDKINEAKYLYVTENADAENKVTKKYLTELKAIKYRNSATLYKELFGAQEAASAAKKVKLIINNSVTDLSTDSSTLSYLNTAYCHAIVTDSAYYGTEMTMTFTTQFGFSQSETVTFTKANNSTFMIYRTDTGISHTVTFTLTASDGTVLAKKTLTVS